MVDTSEPETQPSGGGHRTLTTAPLNKEALNKAGIPFPGHTEILADRTGTDRYCMMQYSDEVTATFVTCHVGLGEVPALITEERVTEVIDLTAAALDKLPGRPSKKIVVLPCSSGA